MTTTHLPAPLRAAVVTLPTPGSPGTCHDARARIAGPFVGAPHGRCGAAVGLPDERALLHARSVLNPVGAPGDAPGLPSGSRAQTHCGTMVGIEDHHASARGCRMGVSPRTDIRLIVKGGPHEAAPVMGAIRGTGVPSIHRYRPAHPCIVRPISPRPILAYPQGPAMQRPCITTDHRDTTDDLSDMWSVATRDGVIDHREQSRITALIMTVATGAALVDDTVRHAKTGLMTGFGTRNAARQRQDLERVHGTVTPFPTHNETRPDHGNGPDAA